MVDMEQTSNNQETTASRLFITVLSVAGLLVFGYAVIQMIAVRFNPEWGLLSLVTILVVARTVIRVPKVDSTITLDDTFIYVCALLYGVLPSVVLAGGNAAYCSLAYPNKRKLVPFNVAVMSLSVYISTHVVEYMFGDLTRVSSDWGRMFLAAGSLALIHYGLNSGLVNAVAALRHRRNIMRTWREAFLWSSVTYFAGAIAACLIVKLLTVISVYAIIIAVPILSVTYLTYKNYLSKVQTSIDSAEQMANLHLRTIEALAIAIDAKDEVTHDHVNRVRIYAIGLARLLGLSGPEIEALKAGALLHDIGKLAVPDYILNKPGKLTPAEYEKMKIHTIVGAEILERVGFPYPVVPVVRHHHERWDGRGYPDALKEGQIPLTARILSVVDCFDALQEDRPYRKALTRDEAIEMLKSLGGTMYDPNVVQLFLKHLPEFDAEIKNQKMKLQSAAFSHQVNPSLPEPASDSGRLAFDRIRSAHREVSTLYEIAQSIGTSLELSDMFAVFSSRLQEIVRYTNCVLYLTKPGTQMVEAVQASGRNAEMFKGRQINFGTGLIGRVVAMRQPMYNADPRLDFDAMKVNMEDQYRAAIAIPLLRGEELLGAFALYSIELEAYSQDDIRVVEEAAKLAADAFANALHHEDIENTALTDTLTGLPNARALRQKFEEEADRFRRQGGSFSILMMDLDGFKAVNDTMGHQAGDNVLREMAQALSSQIRGSDFLARYAGDEFVALVQVNPGETCDLIERIQTFLDKYEFNSIGLIPTVGISMGAASFGLDGSTLDELLLAADRAMYVNKRSRKSLPYQSDGENLPDIYAEKVM